MTTGFGVDDDKKAGSTRNPILPAAGERRPGTVIFHDWCPIPWQGRLVRGIAGDVEVVTAVDVLGHDVNTRDSNWGVVVHGPTSQMIVLGCQIRAVWLAPEGTAPASVAAQDVSNDEMAAVP